MTEIHRDSASAWRALRDVGGLEVEDRDADLVAALKDRLDPDAPDLDAALASASTGEFLEALFQTLQPFIVMFSDVLGFFKKAGAKRGQAQWRISVDDAPVDLRHFEEILSHWARIPTEVEVVALDQAHAFVLHEVHRQVASSDEGGRQASQPPVVVKADVQAWLAAEARGRYDPFPVSLQPDRLPPGLSEIAAVLSVAVSSLREKSLAREEMLGAHHARGCRSMSEDALHPWTIAQSETDYWLRNGLTALDEVLHAPEHERTEICARLREVLAPFPRRRMRAQTDVETLERLLSFPIWKKRHEFYGVWIASQIAKALDGHDIVFEVPNGELSFAFRETLIARIETARPKLTLITERRTRLADPVSPDRKGHVQPDFGLWTEGASPECRLVIEVKHYKKRSRRNFRDVLIDYAAANRRALVILVNHGPVGLAFSDLPYHVRDRCLMLGPLNPETHETMQAFAAHIRDGVGDPVIAVPAKLFDRVAVDISGSMREIFTTPAFISELSIWADDGRVIALIDQEVRHFVEAKQFLSWLAGASLGGGTSLAGPVSELLDKDEAVLVVTDAEGLDTLADLHTEDLGGDRGGSGGLKLVLVRRPADRLN